VDAADLSGGLLFRKPHFTTTTPVRAMLPAGANCDQAHYAGSRRWVAKVIEDLFRAVKERRRQIETPEETHRAS